MRRSLVTLVSTLLSIVLANARVIPISPRSFAELAPRGGGTGAGPSKPAPAAPAAGKAPRKEVSASSAVIRATAQSHQWTYFKDPNDDKSIIRIPSSAQPVQGKQADHILEVQIAIKHLDSNGVLWKDVPPTTKSAIHAIINGKSNLVPIDGTMNSQKGSWNKQGTKEKASGVTNPLTLSYIELSFGTAKRVADQLDSLYAKDLAQMIAARKGSWSTVRDYLTKAASNASKRPISEWEAIITSASSGSSSDSGSTGSPNNTPPGSPAQVSGATQPVTPDSNVLGSSPSERGRSRTRPSPQGTPGSPVDGKRRIVRKFSASPSNKVLRLGPQKSSSRSKSRSRSPSRG